MIQSASATQYLQRLKECLDTEENLAVSEHNGFELTYRYNKLLTWIGKEKNIAVI